MNLDKNSFLFTLFLFCALVLTGCVGGGGGGGGSDSAGDGGGSGSGNGTTGGSFGLGTATTVDGLVTAVKANTLNGCAIVESGKVRCWGYKNDSDPHPWEVANLVNVSKISVGYNAGCAIVSNGDVYCWGRDILRVLGTYSDTRDYIRTPVKALGVSNVMDIAVGLWTVCAVINDGRIFCWGTQLGRGRGFVYNSIANADFATLEIPTFTGLGLRFTQVSAGDGSTQCALTDDGDVWCWGYGGVWGVGMEAPVQIQNLTDPVVEIASGEAFSCARLDTGAIKCWGSTGQLGSSATPPSSIYAVAVDGISNATNISLGKYNGCALIQGGSAKCWGANTYGQLGLGYTSGTQLATPVPYNGTIKEITVGDNYMSFVDENNVAQAVGLSARLETDYAGNTLNTLDFTPIDTLIGGTAALEGEWYNVNPDVTFVFKGGYGYVRAWQFGGFSPGDDLIDYFKYEYLVDPQTDSYGNPYNGYVLKITHLETKICRSSGFWKDPGDLGFDTSTFSLSWNAGANATNLTISPTSGATAGSYLRESTTAPEMPQSWKDILSSTSESMPCNY